MELLAQDHVSCFRVIALSKKNLTSNAKSLKCYNKLHDIMCYHVSTQLKLSLASFRLKLHSYGNLGFTYYKLKDSL